MLICCLTHPLPYLPCFRGKTAQLPERYYSPKTEKIVPCVNRGDTLKDACRLI